LNAFHHKRKSLVVLERRATIQAKTRDADHNELYCQNIAQLACRIVAGRTMDRSTALFGNVSA